jgi:glycogen synthase
MKQDHSWDRSAREYVKIYEHAFKAGRAARATTFKGLRA